MPGGDEGGRNDEGRRSEEGRKRNFAPRERR
jgi:hypothetical protein